jgi:hypothetical protein
MADITIPQNLLPRDGRFGCGPSKVRPEQVAAVAGRVFERHPEASIYNQLCQYDWDAQGRFGEVEGCGGIVLMRMRALIAESQVEARLRRQALDDDAPRAGVAAVPVVVGEQA